MTDKEEKVRKDRDPIFRVCLVVLILASCAVIGAGVYDKYLVSDDTVANNGDTVVVNYVGTFYSYYGEDNAVVFDTTYSSIGEDDSVEKSNDYDTTSYSTLEFTIGDDEVLAAFESAVLGHQAGDVVWVTIPAGQGYVSAETTETVDCDESVTMSRSETMTLTEFESIYEDLDGSVYNADFTSVYGWPASSSYDSSTGNVTVYYSPSVESYVNYEGDYGTVSLVVSAVTTSSITYTYEVTDYVEVSTSGSDIEIQMIKVDFGTSYFYITSVTDSDSDGVADTFDCKTVSEIYNETLYFKIVIVSVSS